MLTSMPGVFRTCGGPLKVSMRRPGGLPHIREVFKSVDEHAGGPPHVQGVFKSVDEQAGGSSARAGGL